MDRIGIEFISALGLDAVAYVELAAGLGVSRIGIAHQPIAGPLRGGAGWSLLDDRPLVADLRRALADHGVTVALGEGFLIMPGTDIGDSAPLMDLMAELGAPVVNVCVIERDAARAADQFGQMAAMADARGLASSIEFMPHMGCASLPQAIAMAVASGFARAGVLVDAMHLFASGGSAADLAAADPARILHAQICDARLPGFYDGYFDDARCNRTPPGEGVLPLRDFVAAVPAGLTIGLELPLLARAEAGEDVAMMLHAALATTRALLPNG
jgi:sugar phosphate isomerase/epimerase